MWDILKNFFSLLLKIFIIVHTIGFEMIGEFSYYDDLGMLIVGIMLIIVVLCLDVMIIFGICILIYETSIIIRTKEVKRKPVVGTVIGKKYEEEYTTLEYNVVLKIPMTKSQPEEYNVKVEYIGITETFNCEELFKKCKKNDAIPLILIQNLDKNNKIIKQKLELAE